MAELRAVTMFLDWGSFAQSGDYTAAQVTNAFNKAVDTLDNILEGTTYKHLTPAKLTEIAANTSARHSHTNKAILDLITAAGGGVIPTAEQIEEWDSTANSEFVQDTSFNVNRVGL